MKTGVIYVAIYGIVSEKSAVKIENKNTMGSVEVNEVASKKDRWRR